MNKQFGKDLTVGSIPRHLLLFSVPMLLGNVMQIGHGLVNTIWVGHLIGENAVGAVGVSFPVIYLLFGFSMGMSLAATILVSQFYGAGDYAMVERAAGNAFSLALITGAVLTLVVVPSSDAILRLMATPPENFAMASSYLKINCAGIILLYVGLLTNFILRGVGDTVRPLVFMSIGLGMNAVLDPFLIGGFGPFPRWGLTGAAYATVISQALSLGTSIFYLNRTGHVAAFNPRKLILDRRMAGLLFRIGLPSTVQQGLVSIGSLFISTFVNSFGSAATNAFGAAGRVDMVVFMPALSMSMAVSALTGQNIGAGKPARVREIFRWGVLMTSSITLVISLAVVLFSGLILRMFGLGEDVRVMDIGITYLHVMGSCYILIALMFVSNGVINGAGHTMMTMAFTLLSLWLVRVPAAWLLSRTGMGITGIWAAVVLSFAVSLGASLTYYFSGRWKKSVVSLRTSPVLPYTG
ncbi:MAG: MATE family efflux transporter [Syntrophorhabdales bacterium]